MNRRWAGTWVVVGAFVGLGAAPVAALDTSTAVETAACGSRMTLLHPVIGEPLCSHGDDVHLAPAAAEGGDRADGPVPTRRPICFDDGASGPRVEVLVVRTAATPGPDTGSVRRWVGQVEWTVTASAGRWDARRHVRWVTEAAPEGGCRVRVGDVVVAAPELGDFARMVSELRGRGFDRPDRKYLVFAVDDTYCGLASAPRDDRPGPDNAAERRAGYARVDRPCWEGGDRGFSSVAAHELLHTLGAVQDSAPHAHGSGHCHDEWDLLCYAEGAGKVQVRCVDDRAATTGAGDHFNRLLDCNGDDYFRPDPPAGSYLATHWNVAGSRFLAGHGSDGPGSGTRSGPGSEPRPEPGPDPGPRPNPEPGADGAPPGERPDDGGDAGHAGGSAASGALCQRPTTGLALGPVSVRSLAADHCALDTTPEGAARHPVRVKATSPSGPGSASAPAEGEVRRQARGPAASGDPGDAPGSGGGSMPGGSGAATLLAPRAEGGAAAGGHPAAPRSTAMARPAPNPPVALGVPARAAVEPRVPSGVAVEPVPTLRTVAAALLAAAALAQLSLLRHRSRHRSRHGSRRGSPRG